jgi:hypothetical protein
VHQEEAPGASWGFKESHRPYMPFAWLGERKRPTRQVPKKERAEA